MYLEEARFTVEGQTQVRFLGRSIPVFVAQAIVRLLGTIPEICNGARPGSVLVQELSSVAEQPGPLGDYADGKIRLFVLPGMHLVDIEKTFAHELGHFVLDALPVAEAEALEELYNSRSVHSEFMDDEWTNWKEYWASLYQIYTTGAVPVLIKQEHPLPSIITPVATGPLEITW